MRSQTALLIAQAEHRLDQLTKPLFGRDVVEELIKEIKLLERGDKPPLVAREIADCHNEIDCLTEELQELRAALEEAREDREQAYALQVEADSLNAELTMENHRLKAQLARAVPDWARDDFVAKPAARITTADRYQDAVMGSLSGVQVRDRVEGMPGLRQVAINAAPKSKAVEIGLKRLQGRIIQAAADRAVG